MEDPPADPQDWTDEQWLEWLEETDREPGREAGGGGAVERPTVGDRLRSSPAARGMGGAMMALHEIFYKPREEKVVIVANAAGDPPDPDAIDLDLDPEHPEASTATIPASRAKGAEAGGGDGR